MDPDDPVRQVATRGDERTLLAPDHRRCFRAGVRTPAFPKRGPDAGTTDQVRSQTCRMAQTTRTLDWPTYPLQTPSGGGLAPTPNRSTTPAEGVLVAGEGLTNHIDLACGPVRD